MNFLKRLGKQRLTEPKLHSSRLKPSRKESPLFRDTLPLSARSFAAASPSKRTVKVKTFRSSKGKKPQKTLDANQNLETQVSTLTDELKKLRLENKSLKEKTTSSGTLKKKLKKIKSENREIKKQKKDSLESVMNQLKQSLLKIHNLKH